MSDQELEKKTGDEGFVAPETGSQQPVSDIEMEKPVEGEITISLDENEQALFMQALFSLDAEYKTQIKEADPNDRVGKITIKEAKQAISEIGALINKKIALDPPDSDDSFVIGMPK